MADADTDLPEIPGDRFWPLPMGGGDRKVGVEIEFAGLTEREAAARVVSSWGGRVAEAGMHALMVEGTRHGTVTVELDTALKEGVTSDLGDLLLDAAREVVPVEVVTPPLPEEALPEAGRLIEALAAAGAEGSRSGPLRAFGLHLNPEVAGETAAQIVPVARAYGLVEDVLRAEAPPDPSRRLTPFVDPWPRAFVDRLAAEGGAWRLDDLRDAYLGDVGSRNHGLDLLPLLEHLFPEAVRAALPDAKGGRPAWHYRLPEAGLGQAGWRFAREWNRWVLVERVAVAPGLLDRLAQDWADHRADLTATRWDWGRRAGAAMAVADLWSDG